MIGRLVVISPCRDEEQFVELTLRSVVNQTRQPDRWIVVTTIVVTPRLTLSRATPPLTPGLNSCAGKEEVNVTSVLEWWPHLIPA